ncbi:MAG: hypothetical protein R2932_33975 [Caldilineaceae bacterium]
MLPPSSNWPTARATTERYVREWLSGQAASGYIEDDAAATFHMTPEQALVFANADSPALMTGGFHILHQFITISRA